MYRPAILCRQRFPGVRGTDNSRERRLIGRPSLYILTTSALVVLVLLGCEEDVTLVQGTDRAFTLYGILNPTADTQYVHVFPIEGTLESRPPQPLTAQFASIELETGERYEWSDSLITDQLGHGGHVVWAPIPMSYEKTYRLEIAAADGRGSHVEVAVPPMVRPILGTPGIESGVVLTPVKLEGDAPRLLKVEVTFMGKVNEDPTPPPRPRNPTYEVTLSYDGRLEKTSGGWRIPVDLNEGFDAVHAEIGLYVPHGVIERFGIDLLLITLDLIVANADWSPPDGAVDPLALAHPAVMTNVQNGYGFVGAGYRARHQWRPTGEFREAAGFVLPE